MIMSSFVLFFFGLGIIVGLCFFSALHQSVRLIVKGGSLGRIFSLYVIRFLLAGAMFFFAARTGVLDLASAVLGFTLARFLGAWKWGL